VLAVLKLPAGARPAEVHAALNKAGPGGYLPIHDLLISGDPGPGLVRAMLDAGGDAMLGVGDRWKALPLHYAAECLKSAGGPAVVELLLARGPPGSATSTDVAGSTPLACAKYNNGPVAEEIAALLRAATRWRHGAAPRGHRRGGAKGWCLPPPPSAAPPDRPTLRESLCGVCLADRDQL
jgi:hypothetical protein